MVYDGDKFCVQDTNEELNTDGEQIRAWQYVDFARGTQHKYSKPPIKVKCGWGYTIELDAANIF